MPKKTTNRKMDLERDLEEIAKPTIKDGPRDQLYVPASSSLSKIAFTFIGLAVILIIGIFYFSYSYTTIIVTPNPQAETFETEVPISLPLAKTDGPLDEIRSIVDSWTKNNPDTLFVETVEVTIEGEEKYAPSGEGDSKKEPGIAHGKITVINKQSTAQELIARTRFEPEGSPEGGNDVFRIKNGVTVPANGKIEVEIFADEPGEAGNLGPSKFYLPGFSSEAKRKMVYAESQAPMTGGVKEIKILSQADIDTARPQLAQKLFNQALVELEEKIKNAKTPEDNNENDRLPAEGEEEPKGEKPAIFTENARLLPKATWQEVIETSTVEKIGAEVEEFTLKMKLQVTAFVFDEAELLGIVKNNVTKELANKKTSKLHSIAEESLDYNVKNYDFQKSTAQLAVSISGTAMPESATSFDEKDLADLTNDTIKVYLRKHPEIKSIEIKESISWARKIPFLKNHVRVKVNQP
ncbi:hypothetical protein KKD19_06600 [Patescibacteria group bacterium]|nr:hypothetical protein [Patescibacteria group bacterium]MBU4512872.1 hypothetical protein [Patescibacteria group bacterium]MCG2693149.1 hypothetical protein [Candidatus Parcubacteria bacterium]